VRAGCVRIVPVGAVENKERFSAGEKVNFYQQGVGLRTMELVLNVDSAPWPPAFFAATDDRSGVE
jgi:hypothetical protein